MITPFLLYIGRVSLYLAIFYAFFMLVMRKTSFFRLNRAALLLGTVACHVLPFLRLRTVLMTETAVPQMVVAEPELVGVAALEAPQAPGIPWLTLLYAAGVLTVVALVLVSVWRTLRLIHAGESRDCDGFRLTLVDRDIPSFSWCRHVVMNRSDYERYPAILRHELQHIRHAHSLDILLMTAVNAVHWFNPLAWLARTELALLHEYEADEGLLQQGIDATQYQLLLVRKAVGEQRFSMANGFNHAKLKQRIAMMHTEKTPARVRLAYVGVLPLLVATMFVCNPVRARILSAPEEAPASEASSAPSLQKPVKTVPFSQATVKPRFQGGDANTFAKWVSDNLNYPEEAKKDKIAGRVMLQFVVGTDGSVSDVKILRGVHPQLDAEAVRVISSSPQWKPGEVDGEIVAVTYQFPVIFQLSNTPATAATSSEEVVPFNQLEKRPTFQGGDMNSFSKWVSENIVYPKEAFENRISGVVTAQFSIDTDGSLADIRILRGSGNESLNAEALRVLSSSPKWEPAYSDGKPARVTVQFPIFFQVRESNENPISTK